MSAKRMPQLVILTFDDSVNDLNKGLYQVSSLNSMSSWLPYSTYLYLDFHLLCSMTKLKEHSREICYKTPCPSQWQRSFYVFFLEPVPGKDRKKKRQTVIKTQREKDDDVEQTSKYATQGFETWKLEFATRLIKSKASILNISVREFQSLPTPSAAG